MGAAYQKQTCFSFFFKTVWCIFFLQYPYQSTGLLACCSKYGDFSWANLFWWLELDGGPPVAMVLIRYLGSWNAGELEVKLLLLGCPIFNLKLEKTKFKVGIYIIYYKYQVWTYDLNT